MLGFVKFTLQVLLISYANVCDCVSRTPLDSHRTPEAILSRNQDGIELALDAGTYVVTQRAQDPSGSAAHG